MGDRETRMREALAALADDDVAALVDAVREEGMRLARSRLAAAYAEELLDAVTRSRAIAPVPADVTGLRSSAPAQTGCYMYAVVAGDGTGAATGEPGVQPGGPVSVVTVDDVSAVVSDVDIDAMRSSGARADLAEDGWLASAVRAHERVVLSAFRSAPTVPMRFGIVHSDRNAVEELLRTRRRELSDELDRLAGTAEWNVKVFAGHDAIERQLASADASLPVATGDGRGFLMRERERRTTQDRVRALVASRVAELTSMLSAISVDSVTAPVLAAEHRPVLSAVHLVRVGDEQRFTSAVDEFAGASASGGFTVEVGGPWPAYHFTSLRLEGAHG